MPLIREIGAPGFIPAGRHRKTIRADLMDGVKPSWISEEVVSATVTASNDRLTVAAAHGLTTGAAIVFSNVSGAAPLVSGVTYYVQSVPTSTTLTLAATSGGSLIDITSDGSVSISTSLGSSFARHSYAALSATDPGSATITNGATAAGAWMGPEIDLSQAGLRAAWFSIYNAKITRASSGAHLSIDFGLRSVGTATAGARLLTNFPPAAWPIVDCLSGGSALGSYEMRMPWGSRASATNIILQGDSPRDLTFHIDTRDKTVSILMDDQVIYSRQRSDLVLGVVRPRLAVARTGSTTGDRSLTVTGFEFGIETNGT